MNPLSLMKSGKFYIGAVVVLALVWSVNGFLANERAETQALIDANATSVSAQAEAQTLKTANAQLEAVAAAQSLALEQAGEAMKEAAEQFEAIQRTQLEQKAVLEDLSKLERAVDGRHTLVVRLANRATRERFDEVEAIFNGE